MIDDETFVKENRRFGGGLSQTQSCPDKHSLYRGMTDVHLFILREFAMMTARMMCHGVPHDTDTDYLTVGMGFFVKLGRSCHEYVHGGKVR